MQIAQSGHDYQLVAITDPGLLLQRAAQLGLPLTLTDYQPQQAASPQQAGTLTVLPIPLATPVSCGRLDAANSAYVLKTIARATQGCVSGEFAAMVTAPVHKGIINDAGVNFSGHTEFIANITGGVPVMRLATPGLRVALVTTHLPLCKVSAAITADTLASVIRVLDQDLRRRFGLPRPRILVCGLNPHAGENGPRGPCAPEWPAIQAGVRSPRPEGRRS